MKSKIKLATLALVLAISLGVVVYGQNSSTTGRIYSPALPASLQGNGSKVQLSTGTTTTNDCVKYDANGNTIDSGSGCGSGPTLTEWFVPPNQINTTAASPVALTGANAINWTEIFLPFNLTVTHLTYFVQTADNSANRYDVCIYNSSGALQANLGATQFAAAVQRDDAIAQSSVTLTPGIYYVGWTGNATTAKLYTQVIGSNFVTLQLHGNPSTTSSGGVCPSSATVPALSATNVTVSWLWLGMH